MMMADQYRVVIQILRQERDVIATLNNPMDAEQLADLDRQIAGAQLGLAIVGGPRCSGDHLFRCPRCDHTPD